MKTEKSSKDTAPRDIDLRTRNLPAKDAAGGRRSTGYSLVLPAVSKG